MRLVLKSPVWDDLYSIAQHIQADNPSAADRFLNEAEKTFAFLKKNPHAGRIRTFSVPGIRSWRITDFNSYLIFYLPTPDELQILAVVHGARDFSSLLEDRL